MKTRILAVAVAFLASTALAGRCRAQVGVQANIPFEFAVGNTTLPPGEYQILPAIPGSDSVQWIRRADGSASVMVPIRVGLRGKKAESCLVFHRYGREYFLSQIWTEQESGQELNESQREKEIASRGASNEVAVVLPLSNVRR